MGDAIDELTGMLEGGSLAVRARQLAHQSRRGGESVALIVGQLDSRSSDESEAPAGLLRDVAHVLLERLRTFDLAYRIDQERFAVLLPGADHERAADTAERLRHGVATASLAGRLAATMSFGVGASREGWAFDYASVLLEAESALASARAAGGNLVCCATGPSITRRSAPARAGARGMAPPTPS